MARGRIIYPAFWSDSKIVRLSPFARLFYIGLWNFAYCDKGHLDDDAWDLKLKILPADQLDADELLTELIVSGRVLRHDGFLSMPKFGVHQKADDPRFARKCQWCGVQVTTTHGSDFQSTTGHGKSREITTTHSVEGRGREETRGEGNANAPAPFCPKHPGGTEKPCGPCRTARLAFEASLKEPKTKPVTSTPKRYKPDDGHEHQIPPGGEHCELCETRVR